MTANRAAQVRSQVRSGTLGNETSPLWVVGKVFNKGFFLFQAHTVATVYVQLSCSVYVGNFSSDYADVELIVACGVVLERIDWPNPCPPTCQQGRDDLQGATPWGCWTMEKEVGCL